MESIKIGLTVATTLLLSACGPSSSNGPKPENNSEVPQAEPFLVLDLANLSDAEFKTNQQLEELNIAGNPAIAGGTRAFSVDGMTLTSNLGDLETSRGILAHAIYGEPIQFDYDTIIRQKTYIAGFDTAQIPEDAFFHESFGIVESYMGSKFNEGKVYDPEKPYWVMETVLRAGEAYHFGVYHESYQVDSAATTSTTYKQIELEVVDPVESADTSFSFRPLMIMSNQGFAQTVPDWRAHFPPQSSRNEEMLLVSPDEASTSIWGYPNFQSTEVEWTVNFPENSLAGTATFASDLIPDFPIYAVGEGLNFSESNDEQFLVTAYEAITADELFSEMTAYSYINLGNGDTVDLDKVGDDFFINDSKVIGHTQEKYALRVNLENGDIYNYHGRYRSATDFDTQFVVVSSPNFGLKVGRL